MKFPTQIHLNSSNPLHLTCSSFSPSFRDHHTPWEPFPICFIDGVALFGFFSPLYLLASPGPSSVQFCSTTSKIIYLLGIVLLANNFYSQIAFLDPTLEGTCRTHKNIWYYSQAMIAFLRICNLQK